MSALLTRIAAWDNLLRAWRAVRRNIPRYRRHRAAGADGLTVARFEQHLEAHLRRLQADLLRQRYRPGPVQRVAIPKAHGGQREIVLLTVRDRVAQRAALQVLEPLWEPQFLPVSFGFRPGRSVEDARRRVARYRRQGLGWVVRADVADCFASLDHDLLMDLLRKRLREPAVLHLLRLWMEAGMLQGWRSSETSGFSLPAWLPDLGRRAGEMIRGLLPQEGLYEPPVGMPPWDEEEPQDWETFARREAWRDLGRNAAVLGSWWLRRRLLRWGEAWWARWRAASAYRRRRHGAWLAGGLAGAALVSAGLALYWTRRAGPPPVGVLQGSPLSPLLANIYLHPFDVALTHRGLALARFADDWVVCARSREEAQTAYAYAVDILGRLRLRVHADKTHFVPPHRPLHWLGGTVPPAPRAGFPEEDPP